MSPAQQKAYDEYFHRYSVDFRNTLLTADELLQGRDDVIVEIGFGMGDATYQIAMEHPEKEYIGIEVHKPGVGKLLYQIVENSIDNLRVIEHDAVEVLDRMIPENSISGFHIFFPDPWPKKKHHKRRILQPEFVAKLKDRLKPGGYIYAVTDWENYAEQMLEVLSAEEGLKNRYRDYADPQSWRPGTKFERKGKEKSHKIYELLFDKK